MDLSTSVTPTKRGRSFDLLISILLKAKITSPCFKPDFWAGLLSNILAITAPLGLSNPKLTARSL